MAEKEITGQSTQKILEISEISLWLDNYDDIFSDFDPREYSQRSLSDDFLTEANKASRDKGTKLELRLLLPAHQRNPKDEALIKKRLRDHFNKHAHLLRNEIKETKKKAFAILLIGVVLMLAASYVDSFNLSNIAAKFLFVLLEPTGWFFTWFALDKIFYTSELTKSQYNFYSKMSRCEIMFISL